jgi:hypothetical protein
LKLVYCSVKGLLTAAVAALLVPLTASGGVPVKNQGCGAGKLVLDVRYHVVNDVDTGTRGNNWAFDTYVRTVRVWQKRVARFCAASTYDGQFSTIAGASPGGKTTIPAGIRGAFRGRSTTTFRGALRTNGKTSRGALGTKDFQCTSADDKGACAGTFDWLNAYFTSADDFRSFAYVRYEFAYHATEAGKGTWTDRLEGGKYRSHGDITALKRH